MTIFEQRRRNEGEFTQKTSSRKDIFQRLAMQQVEKRANGDVYDSDYSTGRAIPTTGVEYLAQRIRDTSLVKAQKQKAGERGGNTSEDSSAPGAKANLQDGFGHVSEEKRKEMDYLRSYEGRFKAHGVSNKEIAKMEQIIRKKMRTGNWEYEKSSDKYLKDWLEDDFNAFKQEG